MFAWVTYGDPLNSLLKPYFSYVFHGLNNSMFAWVTYW